MVACIDAALAAQNAVVAAESLGLRTVYIGAMRNDPAQVHELLGLPQKAFVVFGLCVGYADPAGRRTRSSRACRNRPCCTTSATTPRPRPATARSTTPKWPNSRPATRCRPRPGPPAC